MINIAYDLTMPIVSQTQALMSLSYAGYTCAEMTRWLSEVVQCLT